MEGLFLKGFEGQEQSHRRKLPNFSKVNNKEPYQNFGS